MITVEEALEIVRAHCPLSKTEKVKLDDAQGRIIAESIHADRNFPPFDRVTMDGVAIKYSQFEKGQKSFKIAGIAAAGGKQFVLEDESNCLEVMTGAVLPKNTDTVIRYEDIDIHDSKATIKIDGIKPQQNVHFQGSDREKSSLLMKEGKIINAPELAVLATCGRTEVRVYRTPTTAIVSSGDELVDVAMKPLPHQIRKSNNYSISGALKQLSINSDYFHIVDDPKVIKEKLKDILEKYDVLILSGGVSMGKFDYIPEALSALNVKKLFHKVKQRPGKPFWFGVAPDGKPVFALPGNPVSSFMCTNKYVLNWMRKHLGLKTQTIYAELGADINFIPDLNYFAQVQLAYREDGKLIAWPVEGNGSGDLANLTDAHAFMEFPRGKSLYEAGEVYPILIFNQ